MSDFTVTGAGDFFKLARAMKQAGRTELRKELVKGMQAGAKPLIPLTRQAALNELPHKGGLAALVAKAPQRVQVRTGYGTAGVRLVVGKSRSGARGADKGQIRHRVFGSDVWVLQDVPSGWFTDTAAQNAPRLVVPAVEKAMQDVVDKIVRGG